MMSSRNDATANALSEFAGTIRSLYDVPKTLTELP
jgi:hypothetical protein